MDKLNLYKPPEPIPLGFVHILRNHFLKVRNGILRPEAAIVGCDRWSQHL